MTDLEKIFEEAANLQGRERNACLERLCQSVELRMQVESLLAANEHAGRFLESPPIELSDHGNSLDSANKETAKMDQTLGPFWSGSECMAGSKIPERLGGFEIEGVVGRGGMGIVLKARDSKLKRMVAIKVLPNELITDKKDRRRLLREAQSAARISHPNIVTIHAVEDSETPYVVMEYVPGSSLLEILERGHRLPLPEIVSISRQVAKGLSAAHAQDLIHRDIKPANILVTEDGQAKIVDFGLARMHSDSGMSLDGEFCGTPKFMSPEQAAGKPLDYRTDLFSLGSVIYAMCTGRVPFDANSIMAVLDLVRTRQPTKIRQLNGEIPHELEELVDRLMAKDPNNRLQSADDVIRVLDTIEAVCCEHGSPHVEMLPESRTRKAVTRPLWIGLGLASLLLMLVATEAAGWTSLASVLNDIIRIKTPTGTLVISVDDPDLSVTVDGEKISVSSKGKNEFQFHIGDHVVVVSKDGKVILQKIVSLTRDGKEILSIAKETGGSGDELAVKSPSRESAIASLTTPILGVPKTIRGHDSFVLHTCYSPDNSKLASVQFGGRIRVWSLPDCRLLFESPVDKQTPEPILFSPDSKRLLCGTRQWDAQTGDNLASLPEAILAWSRDGSLYAARSETSEFRIHDAADGLEILAIETGHTAIRDLNFSPDGVHVATAGDEDARVWNFQTGSLVARLHPSEDGVFSVEYNSNGSRIATAGGDDLVNVWKTSELHVPQSMPEYSLSGHEDNVYCAKFLPCGRYLVSVSRESAITYPKPGKKPGKTIKIWDLDTGQEIWNQSGHLHNVTGLDIRSDGRQLATCSYDQTVKLWDLVELPMK